MEEDTDLTIPELRFGAATDVGRVRSGNEDRFLARPPLFVVADGMGGQAAGEIAASIAVETFSGVSEDAAGVDERDLSLGVGRANAAVFQRARADDRLTGMGTTLTALRLVGNEAFLAHVGDSRAYLFRQGQLTQLSQDHTLVAHLVREGRLTPEEAAHDPNRNVLSRALGVAPEIEPDVTRLDTLPGDRFLLCSDGLTGMVSTDGIAMVLGAEPDPQAAADRLVEAANLGGGQDNVTVVVVDVEAGGAAVPPPPPARRRRAPPALALIVGGAIALGVLAVVAAPLVQPPGASPSPVSPSAAPSRPVSPSPAASPTRRAATPSPVRSASPSPGLTGSPSQQPPRRTASPTRGPIVNPTPTPARSI